MLKRIQELLPPSPPFFEKDALTDKPARFFVTEIIREKILQTYDKEIPYACEVGVEQFHEEENRIHIMADIEHGTAFRICCIAHFAEAFFLELHIADGENLVHNHDFAVQMRSNGKRKFNIHAA